MVLAANLGFPRVGVHRELKFALESFWKKASTEQDLLTVAKDLRKRHWTLQRDRGMDIIPSNDFSLYDHMLDMSCLLGAVPERYGFKGGLVNHDTYFAMARGRQEAGQDVVAMEMTKWMDTNYHYIVPELTKQTQFTLSSNKIFDEYQEAKALGIETRPVLVGPVSYLMLSKSYDAGLKPLDLLAPLLEVYKAIFAKLKTLGVKDVQIDEPCLATNLTADEKKAFETAYQTLGNQGLNYILTVYFGGLRDNLSLALSLPSAGLHVDLVRGSEDIDALLAQAPKGKTLSLGLIEGRNIWKTDLNRALAVAEKFVAARGGDTVIVAPSCSLLHSPVDLDQETKLDSEVKSWLSFATQKLTEVSSLRDALNGQKDAAFFADNQAAVGSRQSSARIHNTAVKQRVSGLTEAMKNRKNPFSKRRLAQKADLNLPLLPTTTIGSFPQTKEVRHARAAFNKGEMNQASYDQFLGECIQNAIKIQHELDIDVPVHGEFERNDMVEYFGEQLSGFIFTKNGWVQSYGSRCVKPPVIFGDVSRPAPMTVQWTTYAQALSPRPVKGMLTGPITILQWSFVRDDQPRSVTCNQIALAIRDEVMDLEKAGIKIIQIDEPAIREGLPLRKEDQTSYLNWAVGAFRISAAGVEDKTQIHTHMCYSEFNDIMDSVADMDADVISIETSRSAMELLSAFIEFKYPNDIGPGVYDIHSPRIPKTDEMAFLLRKALDVLNPEQIWVNPDCGLKTRGWAEVLPAMQNMVAATKILRQELAAEQKDAV